MINQKHFYLLFRYLFFVVSFANVEFSCVVLNGDVLYVEVVVKYADFDELYPFQGHNRLLMVVCKMTEIILLACNIKQLLASTNVDRNIPAAWERHILEHKQI